MNIHIHIYIAAYALFALRTALEDWARGRQRGAERGALGRAGEEGSVEGESEAAVGSEEAREGEEQRGRERERNEHLPRE